MVLASLDASFKRSGTIPLGILFPLWKNSRGDGVSAENSQRKKKNPPSPLERFCENGKAKDQSQQLPC